MDLGVPTIKQFKVQQKAKSWHRDRVFIFIWLVGCLGFNGPLRQYLSLYRAVSQREGERKEKR